MRRYLLDTDAVSALRVRHRTDPVARQWFRAHERSDLSVSAITKLEVLSGVLSKQRKDPAQAIAFERWRTIFTAAFAQRIVPFDDTCAEIAAMLTQGRSRGYGDMLIAATALAGGFVLVTRNVKHFLDIPALVVINPWDRSTWDHED